MKKFLILVLMGIGIFYFFQNSGTNNHSQNSDQGTSFAPDPSNATFTFDDGSITLSQGKGEKEVEEGEGYPETVELLEESGAGDLNDDGENDSVVLLARSGGGSGVFIYIAAYVSGPVNYKGSNALFVGDRISPQSLSIENGVATFKWLDRKIDEPFASEPTVPREEQMSTVGALSASNDCLEPAFML